NARWHPANVKPVDWRVTCHGWLISRSGAAACETALWPAGTFHRRQTAGLRLSVLSMPTRGAIPSCAACFALDIEEQEKTDHHLRTSRPPATSKCDNFERNDIPSSPV